MRRIMLVGCALICLLVAQQASGQFKMSIGPAVGLNFNMHSGSDLPKSGTGMGLVLAGQADMTFAKTIGLIASLYFYDGRGGSFSQAEGGVSCYVSEPTGQIGVKS
jgi:hypothetical protein